jgi:hypothetical protein
MTSGHQAAIRYEPSLRLELRPGFRCCGISNPKGLGHCPSCGAAALKPTSYDAEQVVMTFPWLARVYFKIGDVLRNLAKRISR